MKVLFHSAALLAAAALSAIAQTTAADADAAAPAPPAGAATVELQQASVAASVPPGGNRVMGVLPNYRTADISQIGTSLTAKQKWNIARKDSFDYPLVALSGLFAGMSQLSNQQPSFGQGAKGYTHLLVTNYADQAMGNLFTEGLFPAVLHDDPRYFRKGTGSVMSRIGYAVSRVVVTQHDGGGTRFNTSEWLGNATAVAISNAYYPDNRTAKANAQKFVMQIGTDAASQVLKEFWPDVKRKFFTRH